MNDIKQKIQWFKERRFVRDVATLQVGTVISMFLAFVASVVFARILGPEKYGTYALIFALASLAGMPTSIGGTDYTFLTLLPEAYAKRDKNEIRNILSYYIKIHLYLIVPLTVIAIFVLPFISEIFYQQQYIGELARWVIAISIVRVFFSLYALSLQSIRKIKSLTVLENSEKFSLDLFPILFVLLGFGLSGLVFGKFLAAVVVAIISGLGYWLLSKRDEIFPTFSELFDGFIQVRIPKYFYFGFKVMIDKNIANLYGILPLAFLGMFAPPESVAHFKIALSYITILFIINKPVSRILTVQLPKSKLYGPKILKRDFSRASWLTILISAFAVIPFIFLAPSLVKTFYGPQYLPVIKIAYLLAPYIVLFSIGVGISPIYRTLDKVKTLIRINVFTILIGLPLVILLIKHLQIIGAVIVTTFWSLTSVIIALINIYRQLNKLTNSNKNNTF